MRKFNFEIISINKNYDILKLVNNILIVSIVSVNDDYISIAFEFVFISKMVLINRF